MSTAASTNDIDSMSREQLEAELRAYRQFDPDNEQVEQFNPFNILQGCPVGVVVTEADGDRPIIFANDHFCSMTGYERSDIIGRNCRFLQGEQTDEEVTKEIKEALQDGQTFEGVITNYRKNGERFNNELTIAPLMEQGGEPEYFVGFQKDVTERVNYQRQLHEKEQRLRNQVEVLSALNSQVPGVVYQFEASSDGLYSFSYMSGGYEELSGVSSEEAVNDFNRAISTIADDQIDGVMRSIEQAVKNEEQWERLIRFEHPDGTTRHVLDRSQPTKRADGSLIFSGIMLDITEQQNMQEQLQIQNQRRDLAQEMAEIGHWLVRPDGSIEWSDEVMSILGWTEAVPETLDEGLEVYPDDERSRVEEAIQEALTRGRSIDMESTIETPDGEARDVRIIGEPRYDGEEVQDVFGVFSDITERRRNERQLRTLIEQKQVLIQEVHHRVKNNMQVIMSILGMKRRRCDNDKFSQTLSNIRKRIYAMSSVHEQLHSSDNISDIQTTDYFNKLLRFIERSFSPEGLAIKSRIDERSLTIETAVPLGIILNEAITNIVQHASSDSGEGRVVRVSLKSTDDQLCLSVDEPDSESISQSDVDGDGDGFGLKLISNLAEKQLGGSVKSHEGRLTINIPYPPNSGGG